MTDKKTDAWMPLWIGAYLADTQHLTRDEHGAYFLLMMAYWRNKGPLQDDDKRLASIVKASPKEWKALRQVMSEFFTVNDGSWRQKRIDAELAGAGDRQDAAQRKAKAAAEARWGKYPKQPPSNAPSMPQALPEDMHEECPTPSPTPLGIGKPTLVAKDVCVGIPPHTQFSEEFQTAAKARSDIDPEVVWAKFNDHYPAEKRTLARWKTWLINEQTPKQSGSEASAADPDSKASIESLALSKGLAKWDGMEHWSVYKARVRGQGVAA